MGGETPVQQIQNGSLIAHFSVLSIGRVQKLLSQQPLVVGTELLNSGQRF